MRNLARHQGRFIVTLLVFLALRAAAGAQDESIPKSADLTVKERQHYEELLLKWEKEEEALFDELVGAIARDDHIATYYALKRLHGGGVGPNGSEFEVRWSEVSKRIDILKRWERDLERMKGISNVKNLDEGLAAEYTRRLQAFQDRVAAQRQSIKRLQDEAVSFAKKAIIEEIPIIFEVLTSGPAGSSSEDDHLDPFASSGGR